MTMSIVCLFATRTQSVAQSCSNQNWSIDIRNSFQLQRIFISLNKILRKLTSITSSIRHFVMLPNPWCSSSDVRQGGCGRSWGSWVGRGSGAGILLDAHLFQEAQHRGSSCQRVGGGGPDGLSSHATGSHTWWPFCPWLGGRFALQDCGVDWWESDIVQHAGKSSCRHVCLQKTMQVYSLVSIRLDCVFIF